MSWTRLDDRWTESTVFDDLTHADRWHYLAMIQFCSRTEKFDGLLRRVDALRASDHEDPAQALTNLTKAELVTQMGQQVKVMRIEEHIPPPSVRQETENSRVRKQRQRLHQNGDHSMCSEKRCKDKEGGDVTGHVTRDTRTGQDRTGRDGEVLAESQEEVDVETGEITSPPSSAPGPSELFGDPPAYSAEDFRGWDAA